MKQVMSREDEHVLDNHGFGTAVFGDVSFNHHHGGDESLDSVGNIPIWLRTFTADTLRYIEYERRSLSVALICNHITKKTQNDSLATKQEETEDEKKSQKRSNIDAKSKSYLKNRIATIQRKRRKKKQKDNKEDKGETKKKAEK